MIDYDAMFEDVLKNVMSGWYNIRQTDELVAVMKDVALDAFNEGWNEGRTELKEEIKTYK